MANMIEGGRTPKSSFGGNGFGGSFAKPKAPAKPIQGPRGSTIPRTAFTSKGVNVGTTNPKTPAPRASRPISSGGGGSSRPSAPRSTGTRSTGTVGFTSASSGGGGGGFSGGGDMVGGMAAASSAPIPVPAPPPPPPPPPTVEEWLNQDAGYKDTQSALQKALADFNSRYNLDKKNYDAEFTAKTGELEQDREFSLDRLMEDYASRGMVKSGLYGEADTDLDGKFNNMRNEFGRARSNFVSNLDADRAQFTNDNNINGQRARSEALARRAAKFGLV